MAGDERGEGLEERCTERGMFYRVSRSNTPVMDFDSRLSLSKLRSHFQSPSATPRSMATTSRSVDNTDASNGDALRRKTLVPKLDTTRFEWINSRETKSIEMPCCD